MTDQPKPVAPVDHEPFEPMACCGRERDEHGGPNPHCECPAELKTKPVAPEVDLLHEEDLLAIEHNIAHCRDVGSTTVPVLRHQMERLIAETRALRAAKLPPVGVVTREHRQSAYIAVNLDNYGGDAPGRTSGAGQWIETGEHANWGLVTEIHVAQAIADAEARGAAAKPPAGVGVVTGEALPALASLEFAARAEGPPTLHINKQLLRQYLEPIRSALEARASVADTELAGAERELVEAAMVWNQGVPLTDDYEPIFESNDKLAAACDALLKLRAASKGDKT